jgi:hypothetical protein
MVVYFSFVFTTLVCIYRKLIKNRNNKNNYLSKYEYIRDTFEFLIILFVIGFIGDKLKQYKKRFYYYSYINPCLKILHEKVQYMNRVNNLLQKNVSYIPLPKDLLNILSSYHVVLSKSTLNILTDDFDFYFDKFLHATVSTESNDFHFYKIQFLIDHQPIRFFLPVIIKYNLKSNKFDLNFRFEKNEQQQQQKQKSLFLKNIKSLNNLDKRIVTLCKNFKKSTDDKSLSYLNWRNLLFNKISEHINRNIDYGLDLKQELHKNYLFEVEPTCSRLSQPKESSPIVIFTDHCVNLKLIGVGI